MLRRSSLSLVLCLLPLAAQITPEIAARLERSALERMERAGIPGLSVAVSYRGGPVWVAAFGFADVENAIPLRPEAMFRLASISKPLTSLAAMSLLEEGKLDLDAPIQRYVPAFPQKRWPVTLRMLLSHQAGIRHYEGDEMNSTRHYSGVTEGLRIFANDPLMHEPGTRYLYSSYGFNLAGAAVESAAGMPYWQAVSRRVLQPSGANEVRPDHVYQLIPHRVRGYLLGRDGSLQNCGLADTSYKLPGGGWLGSAESLIRVGEALLGGRLLKPETTSLMWSPVSLKDGKATGYALGWGVNRLGSEVFYEHSGGQQGTSTHWIIAPRSQAQVVVFANLESAPATEIARQLLAELMGGK